MKVTFEARYFRDQDEWDYFLSQLSIPEGKRADIDEVELDVDDFTAFDVDGNELIC